MDIRHDRKETIVVRSITILYGSRLFRGDHRSYLGMSMGLSIFVNGMASLHHVDCLVFSTSSVHRIP
jgi:hypothetical protein